MMYILLGISIGIFMAAVVNAKFALGPRWISTRILVILGVLILMASLLFNHAPVLYCAIQ